MRDLIPTPQDLCAFASMSAFIAAAGYWIGVFA